MSLPVISPLTAWRSEIVRIYAILGFDEAFDFASDEFDIKSLHTILDRVLTDLQDTRAMVLDLRTNGGGTDAVSIEIVIRFATDKLQVVSKFARSFNGESTTKQAFTIPVPNTYTSPIVVLSSQESASAVEILVMAINSLPNVTLIGDESNGVLSDTLGKSLPDEWEFGLFNEVYSDYQDKRFEVSGVPVDAIVQALSLPDINQGIDRALNAAVASF